MQLVELIYITNLIVNSVTKIDYDNPILNHYKIFKDDIDKWGESIIGKLIDLGKQFIDNREDKELLENIRQSDNNLENLLTSLYIDLQ